MLTGFIDERDNHNFLFKSYTYEYELEVNNDYILNINFNVYDTESEKFKFHYICTKSGEEATKLFQNGITIRNLYEILLKDLGLSNLIDSLPSFTK